MGANGGLSLQLQYGEGGSVLLNRQWSPIVDASGAPVRIATDVVVGLPVETTDTTIPLTAQPSGLSSGDLIWIGGEVVAYQSWSSPSITVTRAQLGTDTRVYPYTPPQGLLLLDAPPSPIGARCTLSRVDVDASSSASEEVVYRGVIVGVGEGGGEILLQVASQMQRVRDAEWREMECFALAGGPVSVVDGPLGWSYDGPVLAWITPSVYGVAASDIGGLAYAYARVWSGDAWCVVTITDTFINGRDVSLDLGQIVQVGRGTVAYPLDQAPDVWGDAVTPDRVQVLRTYSAKPQIGTLLESILTASAPLGYAVGLDASEVDSDGLSRITNALSGAGLSVPHSVLGSSIYWLPPLDGGTLLDILEPELTAAGCAIVADSQGRISAIDWADALRAETALTVTDLRAPAVGWADSWTSALRSMSVTAEGSGGDTTEIVRSGIASSIGGSGITIGETTVMLAPHLDVLRLRAISMVSIWELSCPSLTVSVARSLGVEVGDTLSVTVPTLVGPDGTRGVTNQTALVTEVTRHYTEGYDEAVIVLTSWGRTITSGVYAPSATVVSESGGVVTVEANDYTVSPASDAAEFVVGDRVILCDETGARQDTTSPIASVTAIGTNTLTVTFSGATPSAGDVIVLADYDTAARTDAAWLADSSGEVSSGVTGYNYV